MRHIAYLLAFEAGVVALIFGPPYFMHELWRPDSRVIISIILGGVALVISKGTDELSRCMAYVIGILAVIFSWYRMVQSYESGWNYIVGLGPILLLGLAIADVGIIIARRLRQRRVL